MLASSALLLWRYLLRAICAESLNCCEGLSIPSSKIVPLSTTHICVTKPAVRACQVSWIPQYPLIIETSPRQCLHALCRLQKSLVFVILPSTRPTFLIPLLSYLPAPEGVSYPISSKDQTLSVWPNCTPLENSSCRHSFLYIGPPSE